MAGINFLVGIQLVAAISMEDRNEVLLQMAGINFLVGTLRHVYLTQAYSISSAIAMKSFSKKNLLFGVENPGSRHNYA